MDIQVGDILTMKKQHPCGEKRWEVLRIGADFKLRCLGCGREVMGPRAKFEKMIRRIVQNVRAHLIKSRIKIILHKLFIAHSRATQIFQ